MRWSAFAAVPLAAGLVAADDPAPRFGPRLEGFTYPWRVDMLPLTVMGRQAEMAYMDLAAERPNGRTVLLLHGKNFCGATWEGTARALTSAGYRVIVPDQLGFCKSSKPEGAQYSLELLASNTRKLLAARGVARASIVGHSMGGMLAIRYAIMFSDAVERLVLVNPIGLRDRSEDGVPYVDVDTLWAGEKKTSYASIKAYQQDNYYHGTWRAAYDRWVWMQAGMYAGPGRDQVALAQAKTSEMIRTQPVAREFHRVKAPTTMIVGTLDRTAFGRQLAPANLRGFLQAVPSLAPEAVRRMPDAVLVRLEGLGHSPQVEAPERFEPALLQALAGVPTHPLRQH